MDDRVGYLAGVISRQEQIIAGLNGRISELEKNQLHNNLIVSGITQKDDENYVLEAQHFFRAKLRLDHDIPIKAARRMGKGSQKPMLIELSNATKKGSVYRNMYRLKEERNDQGRNILSMTICRRS